MLRFDFLGDQKSHATTLKNAFRGNYVLKLMLLRDVRICVAKLSSGGSAPRPCHPEGHRTHVRARIHVIVILAQGTRYNTRATVLTREAAEKQP